MDYDVIKAISNTQYKIDLLRTLCVNNDGLYEAIQLANEHNKDSETTTYIFFDATTGNWEYYYKSQNRGLNERS